MAEFQEVMKQFDRMCWHYQQKRECPMACPMNGVNISQCRKIAFEEPKVTEQTVMEWAKSHKEPVYPTWEEWLVKNGVFEPYSNQKYKLCLNGITMFNTPTDKIFAPIPADIAQKLGIEPKEG